MKHVTPIDVLVCIYHRCPSIVFVSACYQEGVQLSDRISACASPPPSTAVSPQELLMGPELDLVAFAEDKGTKISTTRRWTERKG